MSISYIFNEVEEDIKDVINTSFIHAATNLVPNSEDPSLTFERNVQKKGKVIETCVLYVDIRDSVAMAEKLPAQVMAKIYTAFIKTVIKISRHHNGSTRNIIGDRVMLVFPAQDCYKNAVSCAISINHLANNIFIKYFNTANFKCGIGVDFGELRVIKVGIQRNGIEKSENKGLVWTGKPANLASRLTDVANKNKTIQYYEVTMYPSNIPNRFTFYPKPRIQFPGSALPSKYLSTTKTIEMNIENFANSLSINNEGEVSISGGKLVSFKKANKTINYPPILITERVYSALNESRSNLIINGWNELEEEIKNIDCKVYGCNLSWKL